jgi:bacillithiol system protein YtxJ
MDHWNELLDLRQWKNLLENSSKNKPVIVFKHSTRCSISQMALDRWNRGWKSEWNDQAEIWYLDLISHRDISNAIAADTGVVHESPQALLLEDGKVSLVETHQAIRAEHFIGALSSKN